MLSLPRRASFPGEGNKARPRIQLWTYLPTFFEVEEEKKREKAKEKDRKKGGGANGQRDSITRGRRSFFFFFFLYEIIIVKSLKYSRAAHLDANRGKINERKSL